MNKTTPLEHGKYYHVYNRGINGCELFREKTNYEHFLRLYEKYVPLITDTYAWCLMGNHFHLLIRIKEEDEIRYFAPLNSAGSNGSGRFNENQWKVILTKDLPEFEESGRVENLKKPVPSRQFSHLFNSYTKYFNKKNNRTGSLFEKNFRRNEISNENYFKYLVYYIHHNPVHHGFTEDMIEYPWSSYLTVLSPKKTRLKRQEVIEWFDDKENFKYFHDQQHELNILKDILIDG